MREETKTGLGVLEAALLLGLLGDALLRATPWGLNVLLWAGALAAAMLALRRRKGGALKADAGGDEPGGRWLLPAALAFAAAFAWRDSLTLKALDFLALMGLLALASARMRGLRVRLAGLTQYALAAATAAFDAVFGALALVFGDISWREMPRKGRAGHALAAARGLAIALPLLLVFGALFAAADAVFADIARNTLRLDAEQLLTHAFLATFVAWLTAGFLRGMFLGSDAPFHRPGKVLAGAAQISRGAANVLKLLKSSTGRTAPHTDDPSPPPSVTADAAEEEKGDDQKSTPPPAQATADTAPAAPSTTTAAGRVPGDTARGDGEGRGARLFSLGVVEVGVVLGLIDLLFLAFVLVQVRYFFGGAGWVAETAGLTYAEYARSGFFELVWVAALALPLLLALHWLLRKENSSHESLFRWLAGVLLALLCVVMLSALRRMRLYQGEYGLTELRVYTTAFMLWLALVFVWFALTVLRGRRERFACGALVAGLCVVGALHALNPDALIVRANAAHAAARGRAFDACYATSLSADAVPALVEALPAMSAGGRSLVAARVLGELTPREGADWRTWSWSRRQARRAARDNSPELLAAGAVAGDTPRCGYFD